MNKKSKVILAKLKTQMCMKEAQARADPVPFLNEAYRELARIQKVLDDVIWSLSPMVSFELIEESGLCVNSSPNYFQGEALLRINKAKKIIKDYANSK